MELKTKFLNVFRLWVRRPGADKLLAWLENETDFFTAPASTKYHGNFEGGLLAHSLNVHNRLRKITIFALTDNTALGRRRLTEDEEATAAVLALLHDVCKVNIYHKETVRRRVVENGNVRWEDAESYAIKDTLPLGHGEKSLYLIQKHMGLSDDEALAIRWHMGAYDQAARGGNYTLSDAMAATPWVWRLQEADMGATWVDEREG